ncbi:MAG: MOSC domain-containing protein [Chloroflexota bacterium]
MKIESVNVSMPKTIEINGNRVETGIFKEPVSERRMIRKLNIDGDGQADLQAHGGIYKAIYAYPHEHYSTWQAELERDDFVFGQFGENLTTTGLLEDEVYVGNVYRTGDALLQVTQPRVPCFKLGIRMNDPKIVKKFMKAQRTGFYLRVLEEGEIGAGDTITLEKSDPHQMTVHDINHLLYFDPDPDLAQKAIQIESLSPGWVGSFEKMLD